MSTKLSDRNKNLTLIPDPQSPDSAGFITTTADDVVPTGWLEANGQAVSRTTYAELFALIGTTYGAGDGSTTFNLPGGDLANHRITDKTTDGSVLILADTSMTSDNLTIDAGDTITVNSGANLNSLDTLIVDGTLVAGGTVKTGSLVNANNPTFDSVSTTSLSVDGNLVPTLVSGTWTPSITEIANIDSTANPTGQYMRLGSIVYFSIAIDVDATSAASNTRVGLSLPIGSNFSSVDNAIGNGVETDTSNGSPTGDVGFIIADTSNDRLELKFDASGTSNRTWRITGSYEIL